MDKFKRIAEKVRAANEGVIITRIARKDIKVLGTITVSKGNTTAYTECSLVQVDATFVLLHHAKNVMPVSKDWHMGSRIGTGRGFEWYKINNLTHLRVLTETFNMWGKYNRHSLTGYTFLIAYCLANGVDLVELGFIDR